MEAGSPETLRNSNSRKQSLGHRDTGTRQFNLRFSALSLLTVFCAQPPSLRVHGKIEKVLIELKSEAASQSAPRKIPREYLSAATRSVVNNVTICGIPPKSQRCVPSAKGDSECPAPSSSDSCFAQYSSLS